MVQSAVNELVGPTVSELFFDLHRSSHALRDAAQVELLRSQPDAQIASCDGTTSSNSKQLTETAPSLVPVWRQIVASSTLRQALSEAFGRCMRTGLPPDLNQRNADLSSDDHHALPPQMLEDAAAVDECNRSILGALEVVGLGADRPSATLTSLWISVITTLGAFGVARLLCCRMTPGTRTAVGRYGLLPVSSDVLQSSFDRLHRPGQTKLTVGARALAKHQIRDVTSQRWGGALHGSEESKNAQARRILDELLARAVWWNVHVLPHGIAAWEVRDGAGYGARWTSALGEEVMESDGIATFRAAAVAAAVHDDSLPLLRLAFRGFLEPHDPDGHAKGWIH